MWIFFTEPLTKAGKVSSSSQNSLSRYFSLYQVMSLTEDDAGPNLSPLLREVYHLDDKIQQNGSDQEHPFAYLHH